MSVPFAAGSKIGDYMNYRFFKVASIVLGCLLVQLPGMAATTDTSQYAAWIKAMKAAHRGPFERIRWYCRDGSVLPPEPYACANHDGGIQHGQWNAKTLQIREAGYAIANILGEFSREGEEALAIDRNLLKQILLERFLIGKDDGWIYHKARYYRGALQREDEARGESALVRQFAMELAPDSQDYLLLWEAVRLLPGAAGASLTTQMRDLATQLNEKDPGFEALRTKLHAAPTASDAEAVRHYALNGGLAELQPRYEALAKTIDALFDPGSLASQLRKAARNTRVAALRQRLLAAAAGRKTQRAPAARLASSSRLLQEIRTHLAEEKDAGRRERLLRTGQNIEKDVFAAATELQQQRATADRVEQLGWLREAARALYGTGLLSHREWLAVRQSVERLHQPRLNLQTWQRELKYLSRVPQWAAGWLKFHFAATSKRWSAIEPLSSQFIPARLRGSTLGFYSAIIDTLVRDADRLSGLSSELFGESFSGGVRALNPGLARGRLLRPQPGKPLAADGIYLLPQTTADITPVAGIITLDEGNALSHVQLLAANLGIPNVVISHRLLPLLEDYLEQPVVLAVSQGGVVQLATDNAAWNEVFLRNDVPDTPLQPDLDKLDLERTDLVPLRDIRASDSGVIAGPKAANLGELKHFFPEAVTEGLVVPFGRFRAFLDQPMGDIGMSVFEWMRAWYRYLDSIGEDRKAEATTKFLRQLHGWIERASPGKAFREELARALEAEFGKEGSYALFVRSDTNMEDLPGFTGAGLNLTVPNVVGVDATIEAIMRVWASPFTARAFQWRQQRMAKPEHVYPSVLLLKTVAVEKSGVLLGFDTVDGSRDWFTVATSFGIGGAVQGESAEELLVDKRSGEVRLLKSATSPQMRVVNAAAGGLVSKPVPATDRVLSNTEIRRLRQLVSDVERDMPQFDEAGHPVPADIEFGFRKGQLALFQIRPYLRNRKARQNQYLLRLDQQAARLADTLVDLHEIPGDAE